MIGLRSFLEELKGSFPIVMVLCFPALLVLGAVAIAALVYKVPIPDMTQDMMAIAHLPPLTSVLSNLGVLVWAWAAAICLFSASILRHVAKDRSASFLFYGGLITSYLLFDDFFQFHDDLAQNVFHINELVVVGLLGVAVLTYLVTFASYIRQTRYVVLGVALGFLGLSDGADMLADPLLDRLGQWEFFFEDGTKWLGIVFWFGYFAHTARTALRGVIRL